MRRPTVFLGPSLSVEAASQILAADYLPPIKRNDLANLDPDVSMVGIIDGEFYQSLAVSPKEILPLLDRGIKVWGAASIGALRAVELHRYGMSGVGKIFEMYKNGIVDGDDEVALTYDRESYRPISEPMINIRHALGVAERSGLIASATNAEITCQLKALYFPFRSYAAVAKVCPEVKSFLYTKRPSLKRDDARLMLETMAGSEDLAFQLAV